MSSTMILSGHVQNGAIVLDQPVALPEGSVVRVEIVPPPPPPLRRGGQFKGQIWMAPDFDDWPDDLRDALGMNP